MDKMFDKFAELYKVFDVEMASIEYNVSYIGAEAFALNQGKYKILKDLLGYDVPIVIRDDATVDDVVEFLLENGYMEITEDEYQQIEIMVKK